MTASFYLKDTDDNLKCSPFFDDGSISIKSSLPKVTPGGYQGLYPFSSSSEKYGSRESSIGKKGAVGVSEQSLRYCDSFSEIAISAKIFIAFLPWGDWPIPSCKYKKGVLLSRKNGSSKKKTFSVDIFSEFRLSS
jgi:hypothetical protein